MQEVARPVTFSRVFDNGVVGNHFINIEIDRYENIPVLLFPFILKGNSLTLST